MLNSENKTRSDVVSDLLDEIEDSELLVARDEIFKIAKAIFEDRNGSPAELEMKRRKGTNALISCAGDIFDLYTFINNERLTFPRDMVKQPNKLVDIDTSRQVDGAPRSDEVQVTNEVDKDGYESILSLADDKVTEKIVTLVQLCKDQKRDIDNLRNELHIERMSRQTEMSYWAEKVNALLHGLEKYDYVQLNEYTNESEVMFEVVFKPPKSRSDNQQRKTHNEMRKDTVHSTTSSAVNQASEISNVPLSSHHVEKSVSQNTAPIHVPESNQPNSSVPGNDMRSNAPAKRARQTTTEPVQARTTHKQPPPQEQSQHVSISSSDELNTTSDSPIPTTSFANVLGADKPWQKPKHVERKERKQAKTRDRLTANKGGLRAAYNGSTSLLYIENIDVGSYTKKELCDDVKTYVKSGNVRILDAFIISNKFRADKCGCKVTIATRDIDVLLDVNFWPEGIKCRVWEDRKKHKSNDYRHKKQWHRQPYDIDYDDNYDDYNQDYHEYDDADEEYDRSY